MDLQKLVGGPLKVERVIANRPRLGPIGSYVTTPSSARMMELLGVGATSKAVALSKSELEAIRRMYDVPPRSPLSLKRGLTGTPSVMPSVMVYGCWHGSLASWTRVMTLSAPWSKSLSKPVWTFRLKTSSGLTVDLQYTGSSSNRITGQ